MGVPAHFIMSNGLDFCTNIGNTHANLEIRSSARLIKKSISHFVHEQPLQKCDEITYSTAFTQRTLTDTPITLINKKDLQL